jgi:ATP citrate (pro-S)-lyase
MKLVCKPDQLIKRRGKAGLLGIKKDWKEVKEWISARMLKEQNVEGVVGELNTFLIEPFCAHKQEDEYYLCIQVSIHPGLRFSILLIAVLPVVVCPWR